MFTQIYVFLFEAEQGSEEGCNSAQRNEGRARRFMLKKLRVVHP